MTAAPPRPAEAARPTVRAPEPGLLWIRYAPRGWPAPPAPWLDLARGALGAPGGGEAADGESARLPELAGGPFDDVVWLPPVPPALRGERDRLAERLLAAGTPVLVQALAGEPVPSPPATVVLDLTAALMMAAGDGETTPEPLDGWAVESRDVAARRRPLLTGGGRPRPVEPAPVDPAAGSDRPAAGAFGRRLGEALSRLPPGAAAVWPLIAGLTDRPALVATGLDALAAAGVAVVQPVVPALSAADRRRLAETAGEDAFDRLFHGAGPDERAFARAAAARGLDFLLPRPLPRPPLAGAGNRRLAAALAVAAELWLRLARPPSQGQAFFRAARWADETGYDLLALAREGNLGVVEAIDAASRALIEEAAASGREPALVAALRADYLAEETT